MTNSHGLWFERLYSALRMPFIVGVIVIGFLPYLVLLFLGYGVAGAMDDLLTSGFIYFTPVVFAVIVFSEFAAKYVTKRIESLVEYSRSLVIGETDGVPQLYRLSGPIALFIIMTAIIQPVYMQSVLSPNYTVLQKITVSMAFIYWNLPLATVLWVWAYSMFKVFKIGKLPMKLRPFTEERTLGLRPFGRTSLQLTGIFIALTALIFLPQIILGFASLPVLIMYVGFIMMGVIFFFLPLFHLRSKLAKAKSDALAMIRPRYTRVVESLNSDSQAPVDDRLAAEITVIDKIQRDVHQINGWPFDTAIVARLTVVVLSVVAIILAKVLQIALNF